MNAGESIPPKPRSEVLRPSKTRLAKLTWWRKIIRVIVRWLSHFLVLIWARVEVSGLENIPSRSPALLVSNHLGDADVIVGFVYAPLNVETVVKIEIYEIPILGWLLHAYGVIWVHRGRPDRRAIRVVLEALEDGRIVAIAPEGRESLSGSLEEGTNGAAYLALKADVPIIPVTFTGSENKRVFQNMKRMQRTEITVRVGKPFRLDPSQDLRKSVQNGTEKIMQTLARQLPPKYRGVYEYEDLGEK
jgi:1-acyl-sn-glycerol-3-phosphate acyltransferase